MYTSSSIGYIFDCKKDHKGNIGIKEGFNFTYKGNIMRLSALFGVDIDGQILSPAFSDKATGLVPLRSIISDTNFEEDVNKFARSNRPTYSLLSTTYLVCVINGKIDMESKCWMDDYTSIQFYVPKGSNSLAKLVGATSKDWGIVCDIALPYGKMNTFHVSEGILNGYKQMVQSQLMNILGKTKSEYISGRLRVIN